MPARRTKHYTAVIADDHELVRGGLRSAIEKPGLITEQGINVIAEAANGLEAIECVKRLQPDLLLLDVSMPLASGAEILLDLRRWSPSSKIVVITAITTPGVLSGLVKAGVDGLFSKASDNTELFETLPLILQGSRHISGRVLETLCEEGATPALTDRERQTLNMVISGRSTAQIADLLGISARTVEKHRANLMSKMGVSSVVELMARALKEGLIDQHKL